MKYVKSFNNDAEYQQFKEGENYITPNLCLNKETMQVNVNPKINPKLTQNSLSFELLNNNGIDLNEYGFISNFPVTSNLTIEASYYHPRLGDQIITFHIDKGDNKSNETTLTSHEWDSVAITPSKDNKYEYIWLHGNI